MSVIENIPLIGKYFKREPSEARTYHGIDSVRRRATVLFYPIRALFRAVARTQHSEIQAIGLENIPPDGAVFLVGNHPNSLLDFFNLISVVRHPVATAAKDTIAEMPVFGYLLKNHAMMIPVSRAQDKAGSGLSEEERQAKNEEMVQNAVEALVTGRLFNIYAEGRSTDSRKLNKIKLGFMMLALQAEKQFNYNLNLRIVPYGYYYDRINKFQSSVLVTFGKPFTLRSLSEMPDDFLALPEAKQIAIEKKIMLAGKNRLQADIENLIVSIGDQNLVSLIDDITSLYVLSPVKYMGPYENIREKYTLGKNISESIQAAALEPRGRELLEKLRRLIDDYRKRLSSARLPDALIRREYTVASLGFHIKAMLSAVIASPAAIYGYMVNFIPRQAGRFIRYLVIDVKKRPRVDGDESAIIYAFVAAIITYPLWGCLIYFLFQAYAFEPVAAFSGRVFGGEFQQLLREWRVAAGIIPAVVMVYLMPAAWRFSIKHENGFKSSLFFLKDAVTELFRRNRLRQLREKRHEIIDTMDFIIGDYNNR